MVQNNDEKKRKALKENELRKVTKENNIPTETLKQWAKNELSHLGSGSIQSVLPLDQEEMST